MLAGQAAHSAHCPQAWQPLDGRKYSPLLAPSTTIVRSRAKQLPADPRGERSLPRSARRSRAQHDFERCAVELWRLIAPATGRCDVTQPSRDGGRDATGEYVLGPAADPITIDFALEAKCYTDTNSVGVREVARLISRLRHRHFGVFVTTSHFNQQVYSEVRADQHHCADQRRDIVQALRPPAMRTYLGASLAAAVWYRVGADRWVMSRESNVSGRLTSAPYLP